MAESRKVAAILVADIVGYSLLIEADEEGTLGRIRALRRELIDPAVAMHGGRVVKRLGDGAIVEFRSVVEAVRCAQEVLRGLTERNAGLTDDRRIEVRIGIHLGDVVEEADGDLMGDGVNIAARLENLAEPGGICLSEDAYHQVRGKFANAFVDRGEHKLKNIAYPIRVYAASPEPRSGPGRGRFASVARPLAASGVFRILGWRSRRGRRLLFLFVAAIFAIVARQHWRGPAPFAPTPAPPPTGAIDALEQYQKLLSHSIPPVNDKLAKAPPLSFVVLPFANLTGEPEQDRLAEGLTDDLMADLSRLPDSFVVARDTASAYKGKTIDEKTLGRELGARYALQGGVWRVGHMIVVSAKLISTEDGATVWSDRLLGERGSPGDMQAEFVSRIGSQVWRALKRK